MIMKKREQFKKAVIEAIHGLPYEEALAKEDAVLEDGKIYPNPYGFSIGRVMQALYSSCKFSRHDIGNLVPLFSWQLTKEGIELTDDDQTDETIEALLNLLTK